MPAELDQQFLEQHAPKQGEIIFDKSVPGRRGFVWSPLSVPRAELPPEEFLREGKIGLPELSQPDVKRWFVQSSNKDYSVGKGPYPLGSCTMKYNPIIHEVIAALSGFSQVHPEQPVETIQGTLEVYFNLQQYLAKITGMYATSPVLMGGAHGELAGVLIIKAFHKSNQEGKQRYKMLIPDSAHGTNPASAAMAGYQVVKIESGRDGNTDMDSFMEALGDGKDVAGMMITQPSTLGLFDTNIFAIAEELHQRGAQLYGDGANMNALLGKARPGDMGVDVMHMNTHKPLTTPHGGGGPGAGPVMVVERLAEFLPGPIVVKDEKGFNFAIPKHSIGRMSGWYGNEAVLLRAYAYIRTMGSGLRDVSENAVVNANYIGKLIEEEYPRSYGSGRHWMHEAVVSGIKQSRQGVPTLAIAKRLMDYGFHPPTMYFPLIVAEALMVEPTETESKEGIEALAAALNAIAKEVDEKPDVVRGAPYTTPIGRLDEATAARRPILRWRPSEENLQPEEPEPTVA